MVNELTDPPLTYDFGQDFSYAVWPKNTVITLCNVPWNNDYRDIVRFEADGINPTPTDALNAWINSLSNGKIVIDKMSYVKPNEPIRINLPFNSAINANYLRASNPLQPVPGEQFKKDYYYFILGVNYLAPNTTELVLELDVWQTFGYTIGFGNSYIERGHIGIANENAFNNYGRDYLTIPEGLDVGSEYQVVDKRSEPIATNSYQSIPGIVNQGNTLTGGSYGMVLVASTTDLLANPGTVTSPVLTTAGGGTLQGAPSGVNYYLFSSSFAFQYWMQSHTGIPWITQGIMSITIIPNLYRYVPSDRINFDINGMMRLDDSLAANILPIQYDLFPNWRTSPPFDNHLGPRYKNLKKFYTFPYMAIELTTWSGQALILKPESWADDNGTIVERLSVIATGQRIQFNPYKYNAIEGSYDDGIAWLGPDHTGDTITYQDGSVTHTIKKAHFEGSASNSISGPGGDDYSEHLDMGVTIVNLPSFPIVNNMGIAYLAGNAHQIAFSYQDASWAQQRALQGASTDYRNIQQSLSTQAANAGIQGNATQAQARIQNQLAVQQNTLNVQGSAFDAIKGLALGTGQDILGSAGSLVGMGVHAALQGQGVVNQNMARLAASGVDVAALMGSTANNVRTGQNIAGNNLELANWAARGDYANTIAGINAKVQDAKLTQPSVAGQLGGDYVNLVNNAFVISMRVKMIDKANIRAIGEYWLRYGYAVRKFLQPPQNLKVMSKFTYWKMLETYIIASACPETYKQTIRGIFEKGVTVWNSPADIGNIDIADNSPLGGISY